MDKPLLTHYTIENLISTKPDIQHAVFKPNEEDNIIEIKHILQKNGLVDRTIVTNTLIKLKEEINKSLDDKIKEIAQSPISSFFDNGFMNELVDNYNFEEVELPTPVANDDVSDILLSELNIDKEFLHAIQHLEDDTPDQELNEIFALMVDYDVDDDIIEELNKRFKTRSDIILEKRKLLSSEKLAELKSSLPRENLYFKEVKVKGNPVMVQVVSIEEQDIENIKTYLLKRLA